MIAAFQNRGRLRKLRREPHFGLERTRGELTGLREKA
jgi:hypothetical protein